MYDWRPTYRLSFGPRKYLASKLLWALNELNFIFGRFSRVLISETKTCFKSAANLEVSSLWVLTIASQDYCVSQKSYGFAMRQIPPSCRPPYFWLRWRRRWVNQKVASNRLKIRQQVAYGEGLLRFRDFCAQKNLFRVWSDLKLEKKIGQIQNP